MTYTDTIHVRYLHLHLGYFYGKMQVNMPYLDCVDEVTLFSQQVVAAFPFVGEHAKTPSNSEKIPSKTSQSWSIKLKFI